MKAVYFSQLDDALPALSSATLRSFQSVATSIVQLCFNKEAYARKMFKKHVTNKVEKTVLSWVFVICC